MSKSDREPRWAQGLSKPPAWRSDGTETVLRAIHGPVKFTTGAKFKLKRRVNTAE